MFDGVAKNDSSVSDATDRIQKLIAELKCELIATGLDDGTGELSLILDTMTEKLMN